MNLLKRLSIEPMLAWRNVWKNRRRTILTLLTITVGCSMIIFFRAMQAGGYNKMIEDAISLNTGHIQIHEKGYMKNSSIDYAFRPGRALRGYLDRDKRVAAYSERVTAGALLSFQNSTYGAMIEGVDPGKEMKTCSLYTKVIKGGRYLRPGDTNQIIIGATLAKNMKAAVGDKIAMMSQGFDGSIAAEYLTIVGIIKSGNPEYDRMLVMMPFAEAMKTFSMMGYVNSIVIRLHDTTDMSLVRNRLRETLDTAKLEVMGWDELEPELLQIILMDRTSGYIFYFILFMIVAFGVLNTIQMSVFERTREFGVMMAIGTRPRQVVGMVLFESVFISAIGVLLGIILGIAISYYFTIYPIDYSSMAQEMEVWGVATYVFPTKITLKNIISTGLLTFVLGIIFSIAPARRASKLKPIQAIRQL